VEFTVLNSRFARVFARVLILLCLAPCLHAADRSKNLPPRYRHWLNEEVNYIIDSQERKEFLALVTDEQRDSFIQAFWRIRNPEPNSDVNPYKQEHYRRLAYANEHFGSIAQQDGWRTDQGRIYITLGAPKQVMTYPLARNVRPMETWFYESPSAALPPYFYIVFYKRSLGEPFTIYSPSSDGPARLVSTLETLNDQTKSLKTLRKSLGDEVAKMSLTLLPDESVDLDDDYQPSLTSDVILSTIAGLPDHPITQEQLNLNRTREHVTMSVLTGETTDLSLEYEVIRDEQGRATLSYLLRTAAPDERIVGVRKDGTQYYDFSLRTLVATENGKAAYDQEDQLTSNLTPAQAEVVKKKRFGAEARVPLSPGKYLLEVTLTNNVNHIAAKKRATVVVPAIDRQNVAISPVLAYAAPAAAPDPQGLLPFSFSKLRFTPRGVQSVEIRQGDSLSLVFQLWLGPKTADSAAPEKIHIKYVFGGVTAAHETPIQQEEDVDASNRDQAGNFLTGHKLDTSFLGPGTYRLVVSATREGEHRSAFASMNFTVKRSDDFVDVWTAYGPVSQENDSVDDLKRGLSAQALGAEAEAKAWFTKAMAEGPGDPRPLDKLVALLNRGGDVDGLAALSRQPILSQTAVPPKTLLPIAQALTKNGNPKEVVRLLDSQIKLQPPNGELYRTLADACEASGDGSRARDLRNLANGIK
jgi:GWxTD domain-containing protein